jgi:hypothetical protein
MQLRIFPTAERTFSETEPGRSRDATRPATIFSRSLLQTMLDAAFAALETQSPFRTAGGAVAWGASITGKPYTPDGPWTLDDVYDAVEGAANRRLIEEVAGMPLEQRINVALNRETEWFTGRALTETARAQAQFSTPLPIAEGAAWLARQFSKDRALLLEPCAGTGSLIRPLLRTPRLHLHANELDRRRREVLTWLGLRPSDRDALRLPMERVRFDIVLSNPPFRAMARGKVGRGAAEFPATDAAQRFAAAHVRCLRSNGLLITLLPGSTLSAAGAEFRRWMADKHTPLLYLACPEGSYRSRGVRHDALLMVAREGKGSDQPAPLVVSNPSWSAWRQALEDVATRITDASRTADAPQPLSLPITRAAAGTSHSTSAAVAVGATTAGRGPGADDGVNTATTGSRGEDKRANAPAFRAAADPLPDERTASDLPADDPDRQYGFLDLDSATAEVAPRAAADWDRDAREREAALASPVFTPYEVALQERRAPHPRLVVETRSMAGMAAPALVRQGFDNTLADDAWGRSGEYGGASDEQAEVALRVLDAWDRGHGFVCADDVGVGKSREIALLALEAIQQGAMRILITTKNENNIRDLEQELKRVASGFAHGRFPAQFVDVGTYREAKGEDGVLPLPTAPTIYFAHAYNLADFAPAIIRLRPTAWLADEAHEFANVADSNRGIAWTDIHEDFLKYSSRIAYFTATPGPTLNQLCYFYGLRLWPIGGFGAWLEKTTGEGDPEKESEQATLAAKAAVHAHVNDAVISGDSSGISAENSDGTRDYVRIDAFSIQTTPAEAEQVMRELRGSGHFLSRDLWRGGVTFEIEWVDLLNDAAAMQRYDTAAQLCRDISLAVRRFAVMNEKVKTVGLDRSMYQSYLKQLLFDLRLDAVLARARTALDSGNQVVISLHSVAGDDEGLEGLSGADQEETINTRLEAAINSINVREVRAEEEDECTVFKDLGDIPEALIAREALRLRAAALPRLRDPVRVIEQHFGASDVAAITGRIPASLRTLRMGEFQAGNRRVAIISRAGKVGLSFHDVNHRPRTMLVADYEWSATIFKQELGRVDRTGQLSAPTLILMASTSAGERRFAANIAAAMASLGATCKGSAESTGTDALDVFDMAGGIALEAMRNAVESMDDTGRSYFTGTKFLAYAKDVTGAHVFVPKRRPDATAQMRQFLLELLLFPMAEANRTLALWEGERDKLLTHHTIAALAARRTNRMRGRVIRERALPTFHPLALVDVQYEDGTARVIAQGFVTRNMVRIQAARGPDTDGGPRSRRYVQFTSTDDGRLVSGLELFTAEAKRVRHAFGMPDEDERSPASILEDLQVGEKVALRGSFGARWMLHLRRDGRIEIKGAKLSRDREAFMRRGLQGVVAYETAGNFFHLTAPGSLAAFLEYFPLFEKAVEADLEAWTEVEELVERAAIDSWA